MTQDPSLDVATFLAAAGLQLVLDQSVFATPPLAVVNGQVPARAVFCLAGAGEPPEPYLGAGKSTWSSDVEVTVRSAPKEFAQGLALARACLQALHLAALPGYVSCTADQAEPEYLEQDEAGRHEWAFDVVVTWVG